MTLGRQTKKMTKLLYNAVIALFASALFCAAAVAAPAPAAPAKKLTCCEAAKAKGEKCAHKCCATAAREGKVCDKCNPPSKDAAKKR